MLTPKVTEIKHGTAHGLASVRAGSKHLDPERGSLDGIDETRCLIDFKYSGAPQPVTFGMRPAPCSPREKRRTRREAIG